MQWRWKLSPPMLVPPHLRAPELPSSSDVPPLDPLVVAAARTSGRVEHDSLPVEFIGTWLGGEMG